MMMRGRDASDRSTATSRRAARGATRVACTAGSTAASRVMPRPTAKAITTVVELMTRPVVGRSAPAAENAAVTPVARPTPASNPMIDATSPSSVASTRTDPRTWRRLAPMARSRASSRVRWATRIENVLKMMKAPTTTAITPNTTSRIRKKEKFSCTVLALCAAAWAPVRASASSGRASSTRAASVASSTEPSPAATMACAAPSSPAMRWASARVKSAETAPAADLAVPKVNVPTTVYSFVPSCDTTVTVSPIDSPASSTDPTLSATSSSAAGGRPSAMRYGLSTVSSTQLSSNVGGP